MKGPRAAHGVQTRPDESDTIRCQVCGAAMEPQNPPLCSDECEQTFREAYDEYHAES